MKYWAFISYSHRDTVVAEWLHAALERYRIPAALVGIAGRDGEIPTRIFPIFRDREELPSSSDLGENLRQCLRQSRCLIVICSPAAATSRWVEEELRVFEQLRGRDRIVALIANGIPNASDSAENVLQECFPHGLRFASKDGDLTRVEPIAADIRTDGRARALLKIVSGILGIGFDDLYQRDKRRSQVRRLLAAGIGALGVLAVAVVLLWNLELQSSQQAITEELRDLRSHRSMRDFGALPSERRKVLDMLLNKLDVDATLDLARKKFQGAIAPVAEEFSKFDRSLAEAEGKIGSVKEFHLAFEDAGNSALAGIALMNKEDLKVVAEDVDKLLISVAQIREFPQNTEERVIADQLWNDYYRKIIDLNSEVVVKSSDFALRRSMAPIRLQTLLHKQAKRLHLFPTGPSDFDNVIKGGGLEEHQKMELLIEEVDAAARTVQRSK